MIATHLLCWDSSPLNENDADSSVMCTVFTREYTEFLLRRRMINYLSIKIGG